MAYHPLNLALRFILELAALAAMAQFGWKMSHGHMRWAAAIVLPLIAATLWAVFAVPEDPSRSGAAPVPVPGTLRLALELAFFGFATWTLYATKAHTLSAVLGGLALLHYAASHDRLRWLLSTE